MHWVKERKLQKEKKVNSKEACISKPKIYDHLIVTCLPTTRWYKKANNQRSSRSDKSTCGVQMSR